MKFAFLLALTVSTNLWAWGPQGHQIVAEIAQNRLTPKAQAECQKLLEGKKLAAVSSWADEVKNGSQWSHTKSWHFVDIADGETYQESEHNHDGDVITALTLNIKILKTSQNIAEKQDALRFIVHFVGDIHQPLHVGRPEDRGGNDIKVVFKGRNMNLHSLWDSGMITIQNMDYLAYTRYLEGQKFLSEAYDIPEIPFSLIIKEDMGARSEIYNFRPAARGPIKLEEAYVLRNLAAMNERLLTGGKRLADVLNKIFI